MVDVARYFLEFTQRESCGHCTFCRVGTRKLLDILERALCGARQTARPRRNRIAIPDPFLWVAYADLVRRHLILFFPRLKHTSARNMKRTSRDIAQPGRCKALIHYEVNRDCIGCTLCAQHCPAGAIPLSPYRQHVINSDVCSRCDARVRVICPEQAITVA